MVMKKKEAGLSSAFAGVLVAACLVVALVSFCSSNVQASASPTRQDDPTGFFEDNKIPGYVVVLDNAEDAARVREAAAKRAMQRRQEVGQSPGAPQQGFLCGTTQPLNMTCYQMASGSMSSYEINFYGHNFYYAPNVVASSGSIYDTYTTVLLTASGSPVILELLGNSYYATAYYVDNVQKPESIHGLASITYNDYAGTLMYFLNIEKNEINSVKPTYYFYQPDYNTSTVYAFPSTFQPFWADFDNTNHVAYVSGLEGSSSYVVRAVNSSTGQFLRDVTLNITDAAMQFPEKFVFAPSLNKLLSFGYVEVTNGKQSANVAEITQIDLATGNVEFMNVLRVVQLTKVTGSLTWDNEGSILYLNQYPVVGVNVTQNIITMVKANDEFPLNYQALYYY